MEINDLFTQYEELQKHFTTIDNLCRNTCEYNMEIKNLKSWLQRLHDLVIHLKLATHIRVKRGLLNVIGSISKSLFGTLDEDDLKLINENMDKLFDDDNKIKIIVSNQTALIRRMIKTNGLEQIEIISKTLEKDIQQIRNEGAITNLILQLEGASYDLHFQLNEILNVITMGKQGPIISPQVINHEEFLQAYRKTLEGKFAQQSMNEDNFQFILDISNLKLWTTNTKIFCSITIPILEDQQWNIQRIYPIPHRQQGIFIAPLIDTPFLVTSKETYISLTEDYFPKNCKETTHLYLCKKTQPVHSKVGTQDCTNELINHHKEAKICMYVVFAIRELTFIPLRAENHFIIIPKEEITIDTFCDDHEPGHIVLSEAKLIYSNKPCSLVYHGNLMKIGGSTEEITYETRIKLSKINDTLDLNILSNNVKQRH